MRQIRAQITTRSGPPGTKDVAAVVHGEFVLAGRRAAPEFTGMLLECLDAARGVAQDGMVTEVAVLIYPELVAGS